MRYLWVGGGPGSMPPHTRQPACWPMPSGEVRGGAHTLRAWHLHDVIGLQPRVGRGVDEDVGEGVLLVVHLVCRGDRAPAAVTPLPGEGRALPATESSQPFWLSQDWFPQGHCPWAPARTGVGPEGQQHWLLRTPRQLLSQSSQRLTDGAAPTEDRAPANTPAQKPHTHHTPLYTCAHTWPSLGLLPSPGPCSSSCSELLSCCPTRAPATVSPAGPLGTCRVYRGTAGAPLPGWLWDAARRAEDRFRRNTVTSQGSPGQTWGRPHPGRGPSTLHGLWPCMPAWGCLRHLLPQSSRRVTGTASWGPALVALAPCPRQEYKAGPLTGDGLRV